MKQISILFMLMFTATQSISATEHRSPYYDLSPPQIELIQVDEMNILELRDLDSTDSCLASDDKKARELDLTQLVNLGEKIWQIVKDGEPELNFQSQSATAIPAQSQCLFHLSDWDIPKAFTYKVTYKNGFGMEVISMKYKLIYTSGGQFNGRGQYLSSVSIHPSQIYVGWGFKFDAQVHVQNILNIGSSENPQAGMQIALEWSVGSVVNKHKSQEVYFVQGNGDLTQL